MGLVSDLEHWVMQPFLKDPHVITALLALVYPITVSYLAFIQD